MIPAAVVPLAAGLWAGGVTGSLPPADKLTVTAAASSGTGVAVASPGGGTLSGRAPVFLRAEVGFIHPQARWLEFSPGIWMEVEGRVGFGIVPRLRALLPRRRFYPYATVSVPVVVAPYSLLGVEAGFGAAFTVHRHLALTLETTATTFFWGSDLMKGSILARFDAGLGVRVPF